MKRESLYGWISQLRIWNVIERWVGGGGWTWFAKHEFYLGQTNDILFLPLCFGLVCFVFSFPMCQPTNLCLRWAQVSTTFWHMVGTMYFI
jgi:hypothetical protein